MPVSVECPECENRFKVKDELAGRKVRCPKCATVVTVAAEEEEEVPARKQPRDVESGASRRRDGGKEPRPRGKSRKREAASGRGLLIGLVAGGGVLLLVAVGVVVLIFNPPWGGKANSDKGTPGNQAAADKGKGTTDKAKGTTDNPKGTTDTPKNTTDKAKGNTDNPKGSADNPKVTEDNFDRVQKGMSREQVEEILGPGERIPRTEIYKILQQPTPAKVTTKTTVVKWKNGGDTILLEWTADGAMVWTSYVREQGNGNPPKSRFLGFPKLQ